MANKKKALKIIIAVLVTIVVIALAVVLTIKVIIPANNYKKSTELLNKGEYISAAEGFADLGEYKDAPTQILVCNYKEAERLESVGRKAAAAMAFGALGDYSDARERSFALWDNIAVRETFKADTLEAMVIKEDGTVSRFDYDPNKRKILEYHNIEQLGTDVVDVDFSYVSIVALKSDGTISDSIYREWSDIVSIDSSFENFAALKSDGTVLHSKGSDAKDYGQGNVSGWRNIVAVECGANHTVGLRSNGTVIATGKNENNQCNVDDWANIVAISADDITVGLRADGTVITTDFEKDVSNWTDIVYISTTGDCIVGVKADGTVLHTGDPMHKACLTWKNISAINCSTLSSVSPFGLMKNGKLAYDPEMKNVMGDEINYDAIKDWSNIRQPKVRGFYDFDHEIHVDVDAEKNLDALNDTSNFRNKYGTPSTICAHSGCSAFIAESGDTNCCKAHSNLCGNCKCYIDEDAMYCMSCLEDALS